ncbi:aquaporin-8 isoform X2 [Mauremys reevesii]|uniref:aquaporin-8 isoform X2 n=1 Tax=Mauremys reevesii TaxID=260615 RepID=UPI00193F2312|nr:aquaporin-8 isoform X2 [Mauremys reevesii]
MSDLEFGGMSIKEVEMDGKYKPPQPHWYELYAQPCVAELLGSALFIFIGCASVIENVDGTGRLQPALAHGLALGLIIAILGNISGGHFNPAVSLAAWLIGGLNIMLLIPYWLSQLCGGLIGAGLAKRRYIWGLHEPCQSFWTSACSKLLGLSLGLLGRAHGSQPASWCIDKAPDWRQENPPAPEVSPGLGLPAGHNHLWIGNWLYLALGRNSASPHTSASVLTVWPRGAAPGSQLSSLFPPESRCWQDEPT